MGTIVNFPSSGNTININSLTRSMEMNLQNYILPSDPDSAITPIESVQEHDSEPIKNIEDIERISQWFLEHNRYRDNMLWIVGINFGLRVSDLLRLKVCDLIDDNYHFKSSFCLLEKKTANTRKVKKNRYITINQAVMEAVILYLKNVPSKMDDYLFRSESNRGANLNQPLHRNSVERILKEVKTALGLPQRIATHTMRKTFGYHQMVMGGNDQRRLLLLQKMFGHSSAMQTLSYIGITSEEIDDAYKGLNLGSKNCYSKMSTLYESA